MSKLRAKLDTWRQDIGAFVPTELNPDFGKKVSDSQLPQNCKEGLAAFAYSEDILRTGKFDQYASMLTEGSKRKYDRWVSGLNADQKRQYVHDYFEYEKEIKAVVDAAPFVIILYHQQVPEHFTKVI